MFSSVVLLGSDTDRLKGGQVTADSRIWPLVRFFKKQGVSSIKVVAGGEFEDSHESLPLADFLGVLEVTSESPSRKRYAEDMKKSYREKHLPVIVGSLNTIEKEFIKMAFGDSLDLLKDDNIPKKVRRAFVLARFFKRGEPFSSAGFQEKVRQYTGENLSPQNCRALLHSFACKSMVQLIGRGKYFFQGLDDTTFQSLKAFNFDVSDEMLALKVAAPLPTITVSAEPEKEKPQDAKLFSREELTKVTEDLISSFHAEVERILLSSKINERLLRMDNKDLRKAEALLDVFAGESQQQQHHA